MNPYPQDMSSQGVPEVAQEIPPHPRTVMPPPGTAHLRSDSAGLVDELREQYAQGEADQDRTPSDAGFTAWLARRIRDEECSGCRGILERAVSEAEERTEEPSIAELLDQYGNACAAVAVQADDRLAVKPFDQAMALRREILSRFKGQSGGAAGIPTATVSRERAEELMGGAAALRADVVTSVGVEVQALRLEIQQYGVQACRNGPGPMLGETYMELAARLDRIDVLVRGEQQ